MADDLEDFLRRAAQRRQAKAASQAQAAPPQGRSSRPPQYSNARRERIVSSIDDEEEILAAEIVDDDINTSIAERMRRIAEVKRVAESAEAEAAKKLRQVRGMLARSEVATTKFTGNPVQDLLATLNQPGGLQQAVLLREILDRPVDRW